MTTTATLTCQHCRSEFEGKVGRKYCSIQCSTRRNGRPRKGRTCETCGKAYDASYSAQRTCGVACGTKIRPFHGPKVKPKVIHPPPLEKYGECRNCGVVIVIQAGHRAHCGRACLRASTLARRRATKDWGKPSPRGPFPCALCGQGEYQHPSAKCDACKAPTRKARRARARQSEGHKERNRRAARRRRALKRGVVSEPYTTAEIAMRDRYRCGLCHAKVDMRLAVPHPKAPTVDHIIPLASGGDDTKANVQLAHFICNSTKGTRGGGEQLLLFG